VVLRVNRSLSGSTFVAKSPSGVKTFQKRLLRLLIRVTISKSALTSIPKAAIKEPINHALEVGRGGIVEIANVR